VEKLPALLNNEGLQKAGVEINSVVDQCLPFTSGQIKDFLGSLVIAKGVHELKRVFRESMEIKEVVLSMSNNRLGFLTDRTPAIIAKNRKTGKGPQQQYTYEQLIDPIIEGLLKGYRMSGNEINIIAGQFYAAKNGNFRLIKECPGVEDFQYNNSPPQYSGDAKNARIQVWASWRQNGEQHSIGVEKGDELIIQVRSNFGMGDDGVLGKAHSKLFKRVLERLTGQAAPESSDVYDDIPDADISKAETTEPVVEASPVDNNSMEIYSNKDSNSQIWTRVCEGS